MANTLLDYAGALKSVNDNMSHSSNATRSQLPAHNTQADQQQTTVRGFPPVVFMKNKDLMNEEDWINRQYVSNEDVYEALTHTIREEYIEGVQKIAGLWRLYITDLPSRCKLMAEGLNFRGRSVTIYQNNPFVLPPDTMTIKVCDVPLSVHDNTIVTEIRRLGCNIVGECRKEKLRVNGKLTSCTTGNRLINIKKRDPLPRYLNISDFKAKIYHPGQPKERDVTCSGCQEKGHYAGNCKNKVKCGICFQVDRHVTADCPQNKNKQTRSQLSNAVNTKISETNNSETELEVESSPSILPQMITKQQETRPKEQTKLKLSAGKLEITKAPAKQKNDSENQDSSSEGETSDHVEDHDSTLSAATPSPGHYGGKRKQKPQENQQRRRSRKHRYGKR